MQSATQLTDEQLARLKAQSAVQGGGGTRLPVVNQITFSGDADAVEAEDGTMKRPDITYKETILVGKDKDAKPEVVALGSPIEVIFVKSRRRLVEKYKEGVRPMSTSQHGHKDQVVSLWADNKCIAVGKASELRERYPDLHTVQETYVLHNGELKLLKVKGAALGSKSRDKQFPNFYEYLQQLDAAGGIFAHKTKLHGVLEAGIKKFYTPVFKIGEPTTPEEQLAVLEASDKLTEVIEKYDAENASRKVGEGDGTQPVEAGSPDRPKYDGAAVESEAEQVPF